MNELNKKKYIILILDMDFFIILNLIFFKIELFEFISKK